MNLLRYGGVIVGLYAALAAGFHFIRSRRDVAGVGNYPLATLLLVGAVGLPSTLQFFVPKMLPNRQRDYAAVLNGEWWRPITSPFVQNGGVFGSIFNLLGLFLAGTAAERLWGSRQTVLLFFVGGLVGEVVVFAWQPFGAGNSVGNFSLAGSVAVACLVPDAAMALRALAWLALSADVLLIVCEDIHGAAALTGAIWAVLLRASV
jgi:membrane associated rhomboid family serine protease